MGSRFEDSILRSMRRMSRAIDLHSRRLAKGYELTGPQLVCLRHVHRAVSITPRELADDVSLSQGTVSGILDRLEDRGLVQRERSPDDKRRVHVSLTPNGRALVAAAPSPLHERFAARLELLPEGEQAMIDWVLKRVVAMMEASEVDAAPLMTSGPILAGPEAVTEFLGDADPERERREPEGESS